MPIKIRISFNWDIPAEKNVCLEEMGQNSPTGIEKTVLYKTKN